MKNLVQILHENKQYNKKDLKVKFMKKNKTAIVYNLVM